jgi:hypothetical protein
MNSLTQVVLKNAMKRPKRSWYTRLAHLTPQLDLFAEPAEVQA